MKRVLITGFEPFADHKRNPSQALAEGLNGYMEERYRVESVVLPVSFDGARDLLLRTLANHYDLVISLGLAANRNQLSIEKIALNLIDAPIADNVGNQPQDEKLVAEAPLALMSNLPLRDICANWQEHGLGGKVSYTAGTYVCNAVFYTLGHSQRASSNSWLWGFIHLPLEENLELDRQREAIIQAIELSLGVASSVDRSPNNSGEIS